MLVFKILPPPVSYWAKNCDDCSTIHRHRSLTGEFSRHCSCDWKPLASVPVKLGAGESSDITVLLEPGTCLMKPAMSLQRQAACQWKNGGSRSTAGRVLPSLAGELTAGFRERKASCSISATKAVPRLGAAPGCWGTMVWNVLSWWRQGVLFRWSLRPRWLARRQGRR